MIRIYKEVNLGNTPKVQRKILEQLGFDLLYIGTKDYPIIDITNFNFKSIDENVDDDENTRGTYHLITTKNIKSIGEYFVAYDNINDNGQMCERTIIGNQLRNVFNILVNFDMFQVLVMPISLKKKKYSFIQVFPLEKDADNILLNIENYFNRWF